MAMPNSTTAPPPPLMLRWLRQSAAVPAAGSTAAACCSGPGTEEADADTQEATRGEAETAVVDCERECSGVETVRDAVEAGAVGCGAGASGGDAYGEAENIEEETSGEMVAFDEEAEVVDIAVDGEDDGDNDDVGDSVANDGSDGGSGGKRGEDIVDDAEAVAGKNRSPLSAQTHPAPERIQRRHATQPSDGAAPNARAAHEFRCAVATCGATFTKKENLLRHVAGYHEAKQGREFKCDPCSLQFPTRHEKELHDREVNHQRFPCTVEGCAKSYSKREHLNRHALTSHQSEHHEKPFRCEICDIGFAYSHGLVRHKNRSHLNQNKPYECAQCLLAFKKKSDLQAHSYVHTGVLPFDCGECGARFAKRFQLVRHERAHLSSKKPQEQALFCDEEGCGELFFSAEEKAQHTLKVHRKTSDASAPKKEESAPSEATIKGKKRRRSSTGGDSADLDGNRRQLLVCQVCERTFQRKQNLRAHLRTHFEALDERKLYVCPMAECENAYTRKSNLMAHYNAVHDAVRSQRFVCPFENCDGKFGYKKVLSTHVESVHRNPTPAKQKQKRKSTAKSVRARALGTDAVESSDTVVIVDG